MLKDTKIKRTFSFRSRRRVEAAPSMTSWILILAARRPLVSAPTRLRGQRPVWTPGAPWAGQGRDLHRGRGVRIPGGAWGPSSPARPSLTPGAASGAWVCRPAGAPPWCLPAPPPHHQGEPSKEATPGEQGALLPLLQGPIMATMTLGELLRTLRPHQPKV